MPAELVTTLLRRISDQDKAKTDLEREKLQNQLVNELVAAFKSGKPPPAAADDWSPRALVDMRCTGVARAKPRLQRLRRYVPISPLGSTCR